MAAGTGLQVAVAGIGAWCPAFADWPEALAVFRGGAGVRGSGGTAGAGGDPPTPAWLPEPLRRRSGAQVRLSLAVAGQAAAMAGVPPAALATVFSASGGDGANCHAMCAELAGQRQVSPTRFLSSVHNTAAGLWHIAHASRAPSVSLAARDGSFAAGLLEAAAQCVGEQRAVLFVCADAPYPEPLQGVRPLVAPCGVALVLQPPAGALPRLDMAVVAGGTEETRCTHAALEMLRAGVPAARGLPLLEALAGAAPRSLAVPLGGVAHLRIGVSLPAAAPGAVTAPA